MKTFPYALLLLLCCMQAAQAKGSAPAGTVYGIVLDAETLRPVAGAKIYLLNTKLCKISGAKFSVRTTHGEQLLPHYQRADYNAATDAQGTFVLPAIPVRNPFKSYTVFIKAAGYGYFVIHDARIYPDASRTFKINAQLKKGSPYATWFEGTDTAAPVSYGQEKR